MVWRAKVWCASAFTCVSFAIRRHTRMRDIRGDESDSDSFTVKGSLDNMASVTIFSRDDSLR